MYDCEKIHKVRIGKNWNRKNDCEINHKGVVKKFTKKGVVLLTETVLQTSDFTFITETILQTSEKF